MAVGNSTIDSIRDTLGHIMTANESIQHDADTFKVVLSEPDMAKFIADTPAGKTAEEKLNKSLEGLTKLNENLNSLKSRTEAFLQQQLENNNQQI